MTDWLQGRATRGYDLGSLALAMAAPQLSPSMELACLLDDTAHRVAELGTGSEHRVLKAMAEVATPTAAGAAAALVDRNGSETSRLRASACFTPICSRTLGPRDHARLLDLLDGDEIRERPRHVA